MFLSPLSTLPGQLTSRQHVRGQRAPLHRVVSSYSNIEFSFAASHNIQNNMSNFARPMPSHLRGQSMGASQQSTFLQQKIADKKAELANLKDLQALSGGLADQMQMLADKLQTLSNGTEGMFRQPCTIDAYKIRNMHVY